MRNRSLGALLMLGAVIPFTSCAVDPALTSIQIIPTTTTALLGPCGTVQVQSQLTAIGTFTRPNHAAVTRDITSQVTWKSFDTQLLTISTDGLASVTTCANPGSTFNANILMSASAQGFHGIIVGYANFIEQEPVAPKTAVTSLSVIRLSGQSSALNGMAKFIAVGKTEDGTLVPLNGKIDWSSSNPQAVRVDATTGVARAMTLGKAKVTATYNGADGSTAVGSADFGSLAQN
ncbi:Ig-like domain-containing protein [Occallatibacter savannae]|uniref:Ig-like domain-containing protein n=1 Tax=Occallatibacter savannae TaxID=1002691 RepID=UPI0013A53092|nr:Ig-like domain-containing protein [Occallatibacter savannae]